MFILVCMSIIICGCNFLELQNQFCRIGSQHLQFNDYIALIINLTNIWKLWELCTLTLFGQKEIYGFKLLHILVAQHSLVIIPPANELGVGGCNGFTLSSVRLSVCMSVLCLWMRFCPRMF